MPEDNGEGSAAADSVWRAGRANRCRGVGGHSETATCWAENQPVEGRISVLLDDRWKLQCWAFVQPRGEILTGVKKKKLDILYIPQQAGASQDGGLKPRAIFGKQRWHV